MALTYVPVILNGAPALTVTQLNSQTIENSGAINTVTLSTTDDASIGGNLDVTGISNFVNINAAVINGTLLSLESQPAGITIVETFVTNDQQKRFTVTNTGVMAWGPGNVATDTTLNRSGPNALETAGFFAMGSGQSSGNFQVFSDAGNALRLGSAGGGMAIVAGTNATVGTATLALGSATVTTNKVTATSVIFLTVQAIGTVTTPKAMTVLNKVPGTSFQIVSSDATDTSTVAWWILETV